MAKDPAVLFYTSDFLTGTILMSHEQRGKYITLLCLQHQKGILSEKDMLNICGTYDKDVFDKFTKTDEGFFNERMKFEHEKRSKFCQSRSKNRLEGIENQKEKSKKKKYKSYENHMENADENKDLINSKTKAKKVSFEDSVFFDKVKFKEAMPEDWTKVKLAYYYDAALRYSKEGNKYVEWNTAVIAWAKKDELQGKINFVKSSVGGGLQFL